MTFACLLPLAEPPGAQVPQRNSASTVNFVVDIYYP